MSTLKVDTILKRTGTGTITVGQSGDTISVPTGATLSVSGSASGLPDNTPSFRVRSTAGQTISNTTWTKVEWNTEDKDTDSAFSSDRFTVPSGEGGLYFFQWSIENNGKVASNAYYGVALYKNGSIDTTIRSRENPTTTGTYDVYNNGGGGIVLAAGDYVELYYYQNGGGTVTLEGNYRSWTGYKLIG